MVHGEVCKDKMEWLKRSLVCESFNPINFEILSSSLPKVWNGGSHIRELGMYSALVTFDSLDHMNKVLASGVDGCSSMFSDFRAWSDSEWGFSR